MAILPMVRLTVLGRTVQKLEVLEELQSYGLIHLIIRQGQEGPVFSPEISAETHEAFRYLENCPEKRHQVRDQEGFAVDNVQEKALRIKHRIRELSDERDHLLRHIKALEPWGEFEFPPVDETGGYRFWFYIVPHYKMADVENNQPVWECVYRDNRFSYVVVVSQEEPRDMPVPRTHTGAAPLSHLKQRLDAVDAELDELHWRRVGLTRWLTQFSRSLAAADDKRNLDRVFQEVYDDGDLFLVEGWAPEAAVPQLKNFAEDNHLLLKVDPPAEEDEPPTLLRNPSEIRSGESLVTFYATPGYGVWDPSLAVLLSFVLFFAMIVSDAGYGLLLGLLWLLFRHKLKCSREELCTLFGYIVAATIFYGVLAGNYFGKTPSPDSWFSSLQLFDSSDQERMMRISILLGVFHLLLAHGVNFFHDTKNSVKLPSLGWIAIICGGLLIWFAEAGMMKWPSDLKPGILLLALGSTLILFFSSERPWRKGTWKDRLLRMVDGLLALSGFSRAFGDVLSYLRIFALGLASARLASTFNDMAADASGHIAGMGTLAAIMILILGHGLNFLLALMSGVVHGLRLNYIEFFNWGMNEEGYPFRPFRKKGDTIWNR